MQHFFFNFSSISTNLVSHFISGMVDVDGWVVHKVFIKINS